MAPTLPRLTPRDFGMSRWQFRQKLHRFAVCPKGGRRPVVAHRDGRRFDGRPSLSRHCGHVRTCQLAPAQSRLIHKQAPPIPASDGPFASRGQDMRPRSSAATCSVSGTVRPSALTVFRLMTVSNLMGSSIGRSAGLAPRRTRSTWPAARRKIAAADRRAHRGCGSLIGWECDRSRPG